MHLLNHLLIFYYLYTGISKVAGTNEIYIRFIKVRSDLVEASLAFWSGFSNTLNGCSFQCLQERQCVSLLYNVIDTSCKLFNVIYGVDKSEDVNSVRYYILDDGNTRRVPKSCKELADCSGITTDGEYWIYPIGTGEKRVKTFCHNMGSSPSEYITLKQVNSFTHHRGENKPFNWVQCQTTYTNLLQRADFAKVAIDILTMEVEGTDYTFATKTGSPTSPYGEIHDCNGEDFRSPCPYFSSAIINTRETGLVVSPSVTWGKVNGWATAIRNFKISTDGTEITFGCLGWCGICGPSTGSITFQVSNEFVSAAAATAVICQT